MNQMRDTGLAALLERATDRIEPDQGSARRALARATTVRRRRRLLGVAATAAAVAVIAVGVQVLPGPGGAGEPEPAGPRPGSSSPAAPTSTAPGSRPVVPEAVVGERWDPFTVVDAPRRGSLLPATIDPPADPVSIGEAPLEAALLAWPEEGEDLRLLGNDGAWRSVPGTAEAVSGTLRDVVSPRLTDDGRLVAMAVDDGVLVVDVTTGEQEVLPWTGVLAEPQDLMPGLEWSPDGTELAVLHWKGVWFTDLDGDFERAGFDAAYGTGFSYDSDGSVLMRRWRAQALVRYRDGVEVGRAPYLVWGGTRAVASDGRVAMAGGGSDLPGDGGPLVLDAATGQVIGYRPIRDRSSVYTDNGYLAPIGFADADTVVLAVGPMDFRSMDPGEETRHLITWDLDTDTFALLASGAPQSEGMARAVFAVGAWEIAP